MEGDCPASDGREAIRQTLAAAPDVAVLDIAMPLLNGIEATRQIIRRAPSVHVLILSMHAEEAYITQSVQAGAKGYLLKDSADSDLVRGVAAVAAGKSLFSPAAATVMLDDYVRHLSTKGIVSRHDSLSEREREILQLIAEGHSGKEIAELLSISPATVDTHRNAHPAEAGCAQHRGARALCRSARSGQLVPEQILQLEKDRSVRASQP